MSAASAPTGLTFLDRSGSAGEQTASSCVSFRPSEIRLTGTVQRTHKFNLATLSEAPRSL
jgi:hypothetical protein